MKKNDLLLIIGTAAFSFLFYKQGAGLNVFIFSLIVPVLLTLFKPESLKNRLWLLGAFLTIITGFSVFVNGTLLSVFAFYFSVTYLAGVTSSLNASPFTAITYSTFSYMTSAGFMIGDSIERRKTRQEKESKKINRGAVITMSLFIAIVVIVFFFLYQNANPLFKEITRFINLDFISFRWVMFTFLGFLLVYGAMYVRKLKIWDEYEMHSTGLINNEKPEFAVNRFIWFEMDAEIEKKAGIILFVLLNILILTINILDISYLWSGIKLPEGFTFAEYLHKGIYTLIFSCVLAILLIVLIFRGKLNFIENNKGLKLFAYIWIAQNIFIAVSSALRNFLYISSYTLTYKRITIFILLIIVLTGLISAIIKIQRKKNIYYLFRLNSFAVLLVFVAVSLLNWDKIITRYNLKNSEYPDVSYLVTLNDSGLPYLLNYAETTPEGENLMSKDFRKRSFYTPESYFWQSEKLKDIIYNKTYHLLEKNHTSGWKSFNISDATTIKQIRKLYKEGILKQFSVYNHKDFNIHLLTEFNGIRNLSINASPISDSAGLACLEPFTELEELTLSEMQIQNLDKLPKFNNLRSVNFSYNTVHDFSSLKSFKNLKEIDISGNPVSDISFMKDLQKTEKLNISSTDVTDYTVLSQLPNIKSLTLRAMLKQDFTTLPVCPTLEQLDLSDNSNLGKYSNLVSLISGAPNLKKVVLERISLGSLAYFADTLVIANKLVVSGQAGFDRNILSHISYLNVSGNELSNLSGIQIFSGMKIFHATDNHITNIKHIQLCKNLTEADLSGNPVSSLEGVEKLENITLLKFGQFSFTDISPLIQLRKLEILSLKNGVLTDSEALSELKQLRYLDLSYTQIPSLDFAENLPKLEFLNLSGYNGNDFEKLLQCKSLKILVIPRITMKLKRQLEEEIPQLKIIREYEFNDEEFYLNKYKISG